MCTCHDKGYKRYSKQGVKAMLRVSPFKNKKPKKK